VSEVLTPAAPAAYEEDFAAFVASRPAGEPERLRELRREAFARFVALGFPTLRQESWRYTDVSAIARTRFKPAFRDRLDGAGDAERFFFDGCTHLVFGNGGFQPALSACGAVPSGLAITGLAQALRETPALVDRYLGRYASFADHPFVAWNTAFVEDGAFVYVPKGVVVEGPIHVVYVAAPGAEPTAAFPRTLIVAGENSQLTVVESYVALGGATPYLSCGVTEIVCEDGAVVDHYKLQREGAEGFHVATQQVWMGRGASFSSHSLSLGARLARHDVNAVLAGEGGDAILNGLYLVRGEQHVDTQMRVDHVAAHCGSHELYKGILDGRSRGVFNGRIHVHRGAQKTDAKQTNRNLLLSRTALVNTNPQLEIFADDVKCTHGSTVGQLDAEAVFYLRSRGIGQEAAKSLLTYAFASDVVERIKLAPLRHDLEAHLFAWLPGGEIVREAV
jgi:Fe-S cluster assembly protein SufD